MQRTLLGFSQQMRGTKITLAVAVIATLIFEGWYEWDAYKYQEIGDPQRGLEGLVMLIVIVVSFLFLMLNLFRGKAKPALVYLAAFLIVILQRTEGFGWEHAKMIARASLFSRFPNTCQQHTKIGDGLYICYHYDVWVPYSPFFARQWLFIDRNDQMREPPETWPETIKHVFFHSSMPDPRDFYCNFGRVTRVAPHFYWVTNNCPGSLMQ